MWRRGIADAITVVSEPAVARDWPWRFSCLGVTTLWPASPGSACHGQPTAQADAPPHVVRDRVPQGNRLHLLQPAHQQPDQPPVPRLRVAALDRARPLLVDLLRLLRLHPLAPGRNLLAVVGQRLVPIPLGVFRLRHRRVHRRALLLRLLDVLVLGEAAVNQRLLGAVPEALL